ncbi:pyridoxamine 5'-phosphate oxidase family protein [Pectinatus sottacetonis]|uniref:pyridoxamine 5'-phosphate oxidase family protein n=1 Tax=Pectinatus sottacetonis TaxID=1002795 RepID=UPI0018C832F4|nr:pyridoxamine 5'-phosphate oxidase family protein [Pectinatus sottacetonis]
MINEMRRKDRQLTTQDTKIVLQDATYGTLATADNKGTPYSIPMNFSYDGNSAIYLHCAANGHKMNNISCNQAVCFSAVSEAEIVPEKFTSRFKSAVVFGTISIMADDAEKKEALALLIKKYSPDFYNKGLEYIEKAYAKTIVLKIKISQMTGKRHE